MKRFGKLWPTITTSSIAVDAKSIDSRADAVALLCEVDARKLYAGEGYSSLFAYCVQRLHLAEHAAYLRIETARAARRFPDILDRLTDGSVHMSAVSLLAPHLTDTNHVEVLASATHNSKREIEHLVARLRPQADVPAVIRKLPAGPSCMVEAPSGEPPGKRLLTVGPIVASSPRSPRPPVIAPLAPGRYKVQFTLSLDTHDKLRRVQDLMRHANPTGDVAAIFDRALTVLLDKLCKTKIRCYCAVASHPHGNQARGVDARRRTLLFLRSTWTLQ